MWHCLCEALVLLVPPAGATVQGGDQRGGRLLQALTQDLDKQVMVAIPLPFVIEGGQKQIGTLQEIELCLAFVRCTQHRTAAPSVVPGCWSVTRSPGCLRVDGSGLLPAGSPPHSDGSH